MFLVLVACYNHVGEFLYIAHRIERSDVHMLSAITLGPLGSSKLDIRIRQTDVRIKNSITSVADASQLLQYVTLHNDYH